MIDDEKEVENKEQSDISKLEEAQVDSEKRSEEVKVEKEVEELPVITNNKKMKSLDEIDDNISFLPSNNYTDFKLLEKQLEADIIDKNMTEEDAIALSIASRMGDRGVPGRFFKRVLRGSTNHFTIDGKDICIRDINIKSNKSQVKGRKAVLRLASKLGLSSVIQIPLLHSGFWIAIEPLSESDFIVLETELASKEIEYGRRTSGIIYSNEDVMFRKVVMDFVISHLESSSLRYDGEDILDFIKIQDFDIILLSIVKALYPHGYKSLRVCQNVIKTTEEGKVRCNYISEGTVDPAKMLWVNDENITDKHREILVRRQPSSVTIDEVIEYQDSLPENQEYKFTESDVDFSLKPSSMRKYLDMSELWVSKIESDINSLTSTNDELDRNGVYTTLSMADNLSKYAHLFFSMSDEGALVDEEDMDEMLRLLANDKEIEKNVMRHVYTSINQSFLAVVGIPVYTCPNCNKTEDPKIKRGDAYKEIIPLDTFNHFFDQLALRTSKQRTLEELMS